MKDSQPGAHETINVYKYIKANNERFSTGGRGDTLFCKYIKANNERFSTGKSFYIHGH